MQPGRWRARQRTAAGVALALALVCGSRAATGAEPPKAPEAVTTASGLRFQTLTPGHGPQPGPSDTVQVTYSARLASGEIFDAARQPTLFRVSDLVPGFAEALQRMRTGGTYRFWIPPRLGYGAAGVRPTVPPNAELDYLVTLIDITEGPGKAAAVRFAATEKALRDARAQGLQANVVSTAGRYDEAEPMYRNALAVFVALLGERHPDAMDSLDGLAGNLNAQGRYAEAEPLLRKELRLQSEVLGERAPHALRAMSNLAANLDRQGRFGEAEPLARKSLQLRTETLGERHPDTLFTLTNLATILYNLGRFDEAERLYRRALQLQTEVLGEQNSATLMSLNYVASSLAAQGRYGEAEALTHRALEGLLKILPEDHPGAMLVLDNYAGHLVSLGRRAEAEPLHRKVLTLRTAKFGERHPQTLRALDNVADNLGGQRRFAEAEPLLRKVLQVRTEVLGARHADTLFSLSTLSENFFNQGRYAEAEPFLRAALQGQTEILGAIHPNTLNSALGLAIVRLKLPSAADALEPARLAVAGWRARQAKQGLDARAEAQLARDALRRQDVYLVLAEAARQAALANPELKAGLSLEAFTALQDYMVGAASQALAQTAARNAAERGGAGLGALARRRQELSDVWRLIEAAQTKALSDSQGEGAIATRQKYALQQTATESEMASIDARLLAEFPAYFALARPAALRLDKAMALLRPDEAILIVAPSDQGAHVMAISREGILWGHSGWEKARLSAAVRRLLWDAGSDVGVDAATASAWEKEGGAGFPFDRKTAYALYEQIVAPVAEVLAGKRHVFIAAGGVLTSLPFGILVTEPPPGADGDPKALRATSWFADAHALTVIPSIQSLQFLREQPRGAASGGLAVNFAGYGDPRLEGRAEARGGRSGKATSARAVFGQPNRSGGGMADLGQLKLLARLPGTAVELGAMRTALGAPLSSIHLEAAASERAIKAADLTHVGILAFATHGLMAGELQGVAEPGLVFTPPDVASEADDGLLTASEVAGLKLNADWVILSACNTAAGDGSEGAPGLSGLARAFFYAGARNLLVSHWPVRDDVAARLTVDTIRLQHDNPKLSRAEALQQAMRAIRDEPSHDTPGDSWAHPNAWAPFSLIGDGAQ